MTNHTRPWTAILCSKSDTKIINQDASLVPDEAKVFIETKNPGWTLVGLVPGNHEAGSITWSESSGNSRDNNVYIDPFDMSHIG